uniref:Fe2OG dioxygenase domain-containing protein n=1 Tax=Octactis speculum TaxID=3111310 RepID=A0A7S2BRA1_9STRA|mmetsp:Transcript_26043/g.35832  ORF Transcript_26043/g.35832 Transcript_26043/m.35832 type:complete len:226 (+) Transcript_26043:85-762(+)|eukprot:CAMPEP_0185771266 /NCGR_PEP_ID=MMETSP1174-20130828/63925_1 /TAXON_ID=35687 /ORGANISM="Dictyocha speculum, Strain CCMP1381" /LENGTH=225 /DNA_ID=CAMNT_0028457069 /DNA_START=76 /DNA_END=753 /DNA_ORIENTATION=+
MIVGVLPLLLLTTSSLKSTEFKTNGILYLRNFFSPETFASVVHESQLLRRQLKKETVSLARNRLSVPIPPRSTLEGIFVNDDIGQRLSKITGRDIVASSDFPAELRVYQPGAMMDWHVDESIYEVPQIELVYTVDNNSDSVTQWRLPDGTILEERTEPNSLLLVQAQGPMHQVTQLRRGHRAIIKAVFAESFVPSSEFHRLASSAQRKKTKSAGRKGSKKKYGRK